LLRETVGLMTAPVTVHVIDDGDHSFKVLERTGRSEIEIRAEIADVTADWLRKP